MKKLLIASHNPGKINEIKRYFSSEKNIIVASLSDINYYKEIPETGKTYLENALIKAKEIQKAYPEYWVLADDSGIEAEALNNGPGIYSKRYHPSEDDNLNLELFIKNMQDKNNKIIRYKAAIVLYANKNLIYTFEDEAKGLFIKEKRGSNGFGYDPVFFVENLNKTMAELSGHEKDLISHRGKALKKLRETLIREDLL